MNFFNHSTIYRGPPTKEREEAWDRLWRRKLPYEMRDEEVLIGCRT